LVKTALRAEGYWQKEIQVVKMKKPLVRLPLEFTEALRLIDRRRLHASNCRQAFRDRRPGIAAVL
jgi:hypothetical protein